MVPQLRSVYMYLISYLLCLTKVKRHIATKGIIVWPFLRKKKIDGLQSVLKDII